MKKGKPMTPWRYLMMLSDRYLGIATMEVRYQDHMADEIACATDNGHSVKAQCPEVSDRSTELRNGLLYYVHELPVDEAREKVLELAQSYREDALRVKKAMEENLRILAEESGDPNNAGTLQRAANIVRDLSEE